MKYLLTIRAYFFSTILLASLSYFSPQKLKADPSTGTLSQGSNNQSVLLSPPNEQGPVHVKASFRLRDISRIDDQEETAQFTGSLQLVWQDSRQSFDPMVEGTNEKVFSGAFQFNETSPAWYPEIALANSAGMYQPYGIVLRVKPDGTSILTSTIDAVVEVDLNMRRYPFDAQSLQAIFEIVGFNHNEVQFVVEESEQDNSWQDVKIAQWHLSMLRTSADNLNEVSSFKIIFELQRKSFFVVRLVVLPLALIVVLSWSVFWMDRSSVGDRINVSFVGILTAVAYQIVVGDLLPHMSYFTLMNGFVNLSLLIMCATVVINLLVGAYDKYGDAESGDLIDARCRWMFPTVYFCFLALFSAIAFIFF